MNPSKRFSKLLIVISVTTFWAASASAQSLIPNPPVHHLPPGDAIGPETIANNISASKRHRAAVTTDDSSKASPKVNPSPAQAKRSQSDDDNDWQFAFTPYLYMSGISGTVGARGRSYNIDATFGDVLRNMSFGLMGTFQARKKRFVSLTDSMLIKMSYEKDTPGGLYNTAKIDTNVFIFDPEAGIRVSDSDRGSLDLLGGIRVWSVENTLNLSSGTLPGFNVRERKTWFAPVVGFHGVLNTSHRTFLSGKFDIGAGSGTSITTQVYAGGGFRFTPRVALVGGYRYLKVEHDDNSGFIFDTQMNGFVAGMKFGF